MDIEHICETAKFMRSKILDVSHRCNLSAHLGGGLSIVDIMATLYGGVLKFNKDDPRWSDRDRFILSKGHGVLGYYSALLAAGFLSQEIFDTFQTNESDLIAHPVMNLDLGIESSNGSLGHGLSMAIGISLAAKKRGKNFKTYVLLGDGECNEGSVWEAIMSAAQLGMDNLTAIIDYNRLQSDGDSRKIIDFGDLAAKFKCFGWNVVDVDGHNIKELVDALTKSFDCTAPKAIVARTVKGKGVSFMENNNEWHHNRLTKANYDLALAEVGATHV
jgi:transketolase